jgi:hypothetical protein
MKKTLIYYIQEIIERNEKLTTKDLESYTKWRSVSTLSKRLKLEKENALVFAFAYFITISGKTFSAHDMREKISDQPFDMPRIIRILNELYTAKLLLKEDNFNGEEYKVSKKIILLIDSNTPPNNKNNPIDKDILEISDDIMELVTMRYEHMINLDDFFSGMDQVLELHPNYEPFVFLKKQCIPQEEWLVFIIPFIAHIGGEDNASVLKIIKNCFRGSRSQLEYRNKIKSEQTEVQKKRLIEFTGENLKTAEQICVPDNIMKELLGGHYDMIDYKNNTELNADDLIQPNDIVSRELFYNLGEANQINTLSDLLHPEKFTDIQANLKKAGYKSGFCVLLHGTPGTGKTESVLQLAKSTGRLVLKVDIASIRDKFVGETEKNISQVFTRYKKLCKQSDLTPILLFNEADALFNKRMAVKQSVDQMNNSMQNILLEALENFEGILFATTNLAPNMDTAFERRFLYKIKFMNPTDEARCSIWQTHFPTLESNILEKIAAAFHLSGGQIENVARKAKLQSILYNDTITLDSLKQFCTEESLGGNNEVKQIGFKRD